MRRTKQENIEREKRSAIRSAVSSTLFQLLIVAGLLYARSCTDVGWLRTLALILAVFDLIAIPFIFAVLWQRVREIEKGELDEARKY